MIELKEEDYKVLKKGVAGYPGYISAEQLDSIVFTFGNYPKEKQQQIAYEYMLMVWYTGDKFDDHFKVAQEKHYYWRHKKTGQLLMNNTTVGDGPFLAIDEPFLVTGKNTKVMDYVPAWLTPSEMVDMGFNIHYFDNLKVIE